MASSSKHNNKSVKRLKNRKFTKRSKESVNNVSKIGANLSAAKQFPDAQKSKAKNICLETKPTFSNHDDIKQTETITILVNGKHDLDLNENIKTYNLLSDNKYESRLSNYRDCLKKKSWRNDNHRVLKSKKNDLSVVIPIYNEPSTSQLDFTNKINDEFPSTDSTLSRNFINKSGSQVLPLETNSRDWLNEFSTQITHNNAINLNNTGFTAMNDIEQTDRRKFYIVQNGGSPAEMYCTDLVHRAKHSRLRNVDERRLMKCTDRWREEWNHGVQMPLSKDRPAYYFEKISLFSELEVVNFVQSKKYVAFNNKKYVKNLSENFERRALPPLYQYEIDNSDEEWLNSKEGNHLSRLDFLKVMNELELECYKNIHIYVLEHLTFSRDSAKTDDDADCDICCMPEWEPGDEIVFCDDCNMSVHQSCYGLNTLPTDDWMCAVCIHRTYIEKSSAELPPPCIFCPILGGAMKSTKNADAWAHVVCALWIPEVRFTDVERREPITHVSDVPVDRWKAKCSICDTCNGACIRCTHLGCNASFHVSCAQRSGLTLQIEQNQEAKNGVSMISLCSNHSSTNLTRQSTSGRRSSSSVSNFDRNNLSEMSQNFFKHVNLQKVLDTCNVSQQTLNSIFTYWRWKRKMNSCQSLMIEPIDLKLAVPPKQINASQVARQKSNIFSQIPSDQLLRNFEKIRAIRLNLEKARNLCYMVSRREKLKKTYLETFEQSTLTMGSLLLDVIVPVSMRRAEKLLETWSSTTKEMLSLERKHVSSKNSTVLSSSNLFWNGLNAFDTPIISKENNILSNTIQTNGYRYQQKTLDNDNNKSSKTSEFYDLRNGYHHYSLNTSLQLPSPPSLSYHSPSEQKRREELYVFRSSNSPILPNEVSKSFDNNNHNFNNSIELDGNISDASNFTEYSVAWSNSSTSNGALFDIENGISPVRLKNERKKKPLSVKMKESISLNEDLKLKKVNIKETKRKLNFNGLKNSSSNAGGYVLHHPELALSTRRVSRSSNVTRRIV